MRRVTSRNRALPPGSLSRWRLPALSSSSSLARIPDSAAVR
jgi:hypothetical protein